jgi:hypothetical protein
LLRFGDDWQKQFVTVKRPHHRKEDVNQNASAKRQPSRGKKI